MKRLGILAVLAAALLTACSGSKSAKVPVYVWEPINENTDMGVFREQMLQWKENGVTGVCIENHNPEIVKKASALAHEVGLEYHAWIPCVIMADKPLDWYAVNRLGQNAKEHPAYVPHYTALDPHNPDVHKFFVEEMTGIASLPDVDYVQLDFIRYPDVILPRGLWDKYGLVMDEEYAPADYCYCDGCVTEFKELTGIDIRAVEDPSKVEEWAQFRCNNVTSLVNEICSAVHKLGKKVSADVFPGPDSHAKWMVRQDWGKWDVDMLFPMNYNDFYLEGPGWLADIVKEEVAAAGDVPVMSGLFICPDWRNKDKVVDPEYSGLLPSEVGEAVKGSLKSGASGICLFMPSRMSVEHWAAVVEALK